PAAVEPPAAAVEPPAAAVEPPAAKQAPPAPPRPAETAVPTPAAPPAASQPAAETAVDEDMGPDVQEGEVASSLLREMLDKMSVRATVRVAASEPDDLTGRRVNVLNIEGEDLNVLIGPRGETLNALQYVLRLMVGHRMHQRAHFVVDVQGYRERRALALTRLAERMAKKAMRQQRPISLEPMPPYERRIIHMALRDHEAVYTHSVGEGDRRKVRIMPK
ncbi:MAG: KH domain-containing protein, partial [Anaerolineales bacterium]|nr:KH domain-containing protein [Anaerolineales bacterium]